MKAIIYTEPKQTRLVTDRPLPKLREHTVIVEVAAVALNPTDWKHQSNSPEWQKGDRICGFVHGENSVNPDDGSFAEYIVAPLSTAMRIPEGVSMEAASNLGAGYSVLTTCSPRNFEMVRARGVTEAFDSNDLEVGKKINAYTNNSLRFAWDCIGTDSAGSRPDLCP
ncbi:hypothetical protein N7507_009829 [Penicillium longicatenatum]|nr:hypothetical protein N7507_009829 [Penicillium longicatenatum]